MFTHLSNQSTKMRNKIKTLFEYRSIPKLMKDGKLKGKKAFLEHLYDLQVSIYHLDEYLESNWNISKSILNAHWKEIHAAMRSCGVPKTDLIAYSKHILKYQTHELNLRKNKLPTAGSIEYYYYYKSCDVRLMRQLIYDQANDLESSYTLSDWRYFDLITEVNDDVQDVFEDLKTINGNYVLISAWEFGKKESLKILHDFINQIELKNKERLSKRKSDSNYKRIYKMTKAQIKVTRKLLDKNMKKLKKKKIQKAVLMEYLHNEFKIKS